MRPTIIGYQLLTPISIGGYLSEFGYALLNILDILFHSIADIINDNNTDSAVDIIIIQAYNSKM